MKIKSRLAVMATLMSLSLILPWGKAMGQTLTGSYYWMNGDSTTHGSGGRIDPLNLSVSPGGSGTMTAKPNTGEKALKWMRYLGSPNPQTVPSSFTEIGNAAEPLVWKESSSTYGASVIIGLVCDWIRYSLQYEGGATTNLVYTNQVTIAGTAQEKTGYLFDSQWTNDVGKVFKTGAKVTGADFGLTNHNDDAGIVLYPVWKTNRCSLTYDTAGGEFPGPRPTVAVYDTAFEVSDPVRTGYGLKEWSISPKPDEKLAKVTRLDGKTRFLNISAENNATIKLTAVWTNCKYKVTFNNHGAIIGPDQPMYVDFGEAYDSVNVPQKNGSTFIGYFMSDKSGEMLWDDEGQPASSVWKWVADVTAHAQWKAEEFDIEYDPNGGSGVITALHVTNGVETVLSDGIGVSRPGCTFMGWSKVSTGTVQYAPGAKVTFEEKIEKLYAVWEMPYYVSYDGHRATSGEMKVQKFIRGKESYLTLNEYARQGYTFAGWAESEALADQLTAKYQDGQAVTNLSDVPGATNVLYAVWHTNTYYVAFDPGRGSGEPMEPQKFVYDEAQELTKNTYKEPSELHRFVGWENPLNGEIIPDGAVVSNLCTVADGTNTLKAIWSANVGGLSEHMHCTGLHWGVRQGVDLSDIVWKQNDGFEYGCTNTGMSVSQDDGSWNNKEWLQATVPTNGTLKFSCRWVRGESQSEAPVLAVGLDISPDGSNFNNAELFPGGAFGYRTIQFDQADEWIAVALEIPLALEQSQTVIRLANQTTGTGGYVEIDQMVWEPEGGSVVPPEEPREPVAVPQAVSGLTYDGKEKTGVLAGEGYWLTGNTAVRPGDYEAVATPLYGYRWDNGKSDDTNAVTIAWSIGKAVKDLSGVTFEDKTFVYDGTERKIAVSGTVPDGVTVTYEGGASRTAAGTNEVKACFAFTDPSEAELYELSPESLTAKLIIQRGRKNVDDVTLEDKTFVYDGTSHSIAVTNELPDGVELVYAGETNRVDAGTNEVTVTFKLADPDNYEPIDKELKARLIVLKGVKDVSGVTFPDVTCVYDGKSHELKVAGEIPEGVRVEYEGVTSASEVGTYQATARFVVEDEKNWEKIDKVLTATLTIDEAPVPPPPPPPPPPPFDPTVAYLNVYHKAALQDLGVIGVPTDRKVTVKAEGLPKGLKLVTTAVKEGKKVVRYEYRVEGVPTETMDGVTRRAYVRVTDGKAKTLYKLDLCVKPAEDYEQRSFPDGTNGVTYANYSVTKLWPDVSSNAANWTISGLPSGLKYTKKAVTAKKKIDGVTVTVTNALPYEVYGKPTKAGRFTVKAVEKISGTSYKTTHVATLAVWPVALEPAAEWTDQAYVEIANRKSADDVTKASGLPSGVKFTAKDIVSKGQVVTKAHQFYGKPTKAGTAVVTLTHADKSKTQFFWTITPADVPEFELKLTETSVSPETAKATVLQGVAYDWAITNTPGAKVSASGLPTGLKLASTAVKVSGKTVGTLYAVRGVPTKEGEYFATFKTTLNGMTRVSTAAFVVKPLPAWAQGTFDGGADGTFAVGGQVTLTLSKVGKLSGKWLCEGKSWTLSAPSYDRYDEAAGAYVAKLVRKTGSGKSAVIVTNELTVVAAAELVGMATNELFLAYRNNWKTEPWKTVAKGFAKGGEVVWHPHADGGDVSTNDTITLKFAATGKVTVKGKFVKSVSEKGKISWHTASGSAVLCPQAEVTAGEPFDGAVFVYFPPKAKTPLEEGLAVCLAVRWNGQKFESEALPWSPDGE